MTKWHDPEFYAVVWIRNGETLYEGDNAANAALAWVPGTCHGSGRSKFEAVENAKKTAEQLRNNPVSNRDPATPGANTRG